MIWPKDFPELEMPPPLRDYECFYLRMRLIQDVAYGSSFRNFSVPIVTRITFLVKGEQIQQVIMSGEIGSLDRPSFQGTGTLGLGQNWLVGLVGNAWM
jgi:hypothetical protein